MTAVLHLFDSQTPPPALDILERLRRSRPNDRTACVGSAAGRVDLPAADYALRRPGPWTVMAGAGVRELITPNGISVVHCWSAGLAPLATLLGPGVCVSLFRPPGARDLTACREAVRAGAVVVASSDAGRRRLVSDGLPVEAIEIVAPAVEPGPADASLRREARSHWDWADTDRVVVTRAESDADDSAYWTAWAAGILHQMGEPVRLLVMGSPTARRRAEELSRRNGLSRLVHLVERSDRDLAWAAADVAVAYDTDGFGLTGAAAAVGAGVAVVAADAGELRDTFVDERNALLVKPKTPRLLARALWRLFEDPPLRIRLAHNALKEPAGGHNGASMEGRMKALYARIRPPSPRG